VRARRRPRYLGAPRWRALRLRGWRRGGGCRRCGCARRDSHRQRAAAFGIFRKLRGRMSDVRHPAPHHDRMKQHRERESNRDRAPRYTLAPRKVCER
jgi:hypothetical protein